MKFHQLIFLLGAIALTACGPIDQALYGENVREVMVGGIPWKVAPIPDNKGVYAVSIKDGIYKSSQVISRRPDALKAVELVSGCKIKPETVIQLNNVGSAFTAQVRC